MRSAANADLAQDYDRVVVLAPIPRGVGPMAQRRRAGHRDGRRGSPSSRPDADSKTAIGKNVLDPAAPAPSAEAGRRQAASVAARVAEVWNG